MMSSTGSRSVILSPDNFFFNRLIKNLAQNSSSDNYHQLQSQIISDLRDILIISFLYKRMLLKDISDSIGG
jgi:hypothetical protein